MSGLGIPGPVGAAKAKLLSSKENDVGAPPSRKNQDLGVLAASQKTEQVILELRAQNTFLEDQVRRLSEELARGQNYGGGAGSIGDPGREGGSSVVGGVTKASFLEGLVEGAPLPPWLTDVQYLSPLLVAYDKRIRDQAAQLRERDDALGALQGQTREVVRENEKLAGDLAHHVALLAKRTEADVEGLSEDSLEMLERIDLLTQENNLLVQQQNEQEKEIVQLNGSLERATQDTVRLGSELSSAIFQLKNTQNDCLELDAMCAELQTEVKKLAKKCMETEQARDLEVNDMRNAQHQLGTAKQLLEQELGRAQTELQTLQQEHQVLSQRESDQSVLIVNLQREVEQAREQVMVANSDASVSREEATNLQQALVGVERRLAEHQSREVEVHSRLKEARERADEALLARDQVLTKQKGLEEEVAMLQKKLAGAQKEHQQREDAEVQLHAEALSKEKAQAADQLRVVLERETEAKVALEQAQANAKELDARIENLERALKDAGDSDPELEMRLRAAEAAQDIAEERASSNQRSAQLAMQEWERERASLVAAAEEATQRLQQALQQETALRHQVADLQVRMDQAEQEKRSYRRERAHEESSTRRDREASKRQAEGQLKALSQRLDQALEAQKVAAEDGEAALRSKEIILAKYREEIKSMGVKHDQAQVELRGRVEKVQKRAEEAEKELAALKAQYSTLQADARKWKEAEKKLHPRCEAAEARAHQLQAQLQEATSQEEDLMAARKELHGAVDRLSMERSKALRGQELALQKCDQLKRQLETAQMIAAGGGGGGRGRDESGRHRSDSASRRRPKEDREKRSRSRADEVALTAAISAE